MILVGTSTGHMLLYKGRQQLLKKHKCFILSEALWHPKGRPTKCFSNPPVKSRLVQARRLNLVLAPLPSNMMLCILSGCLVCVMTSSLRGANARHRRFGVAKRPAQHPAVKSAALGESCTGTAVDCLTRLICSSAAHFPLIILIHLWFPL